MLEVVSQPKSRESMSLIVMMTAEFDKNGEPSKHTKFNIARTLLVGHTVHCKDPHRRYAYVVPDCTRHEGDGQRLCDVVSLKLLERDLYCSKVIVPPADAEFVTIEQHVAFLNEVKAGLEGEYHTVV